MDPASSSYSAGIVGISTLKARQLLSVAQLMTACIWVQAVYASDIALDCHLQNAKDAGSQRVKEACRIDGWPKLLRVCEVHCAI